MKKHGFYLFLLVSIMISFFTACGGGGGGGGGDKTDSRVNNYNVNLKTLSVSSGTLSPVFSPDTTSYNLEVTGTTASIVIKPEISDSTSYITVNSQVVSSGGSHTETIDADMKTITVVVKAPDNSTTKTYYISVNRVSGPSGNANLAGLEISEGTLSPSFSANTTGYNVDVPYDTTGIYVTPTVAGINAAVTVNDEPVDSGEESSFIPLTFAITVITVKVTAENGTQKTYIIAVNSTDGTSNANLADLRVSAGTLSGGFDPDDPDYDVIVSYVTTGITVTPTVAVSGSTVTVNGVEVSSGRASGTINLNVGANLITITVTSEDDTVKTYSVNVRRVAADDNADLADLSVSAGTLSPSFDIYTTGYNVDVPYAVTSITVTPTVFASTSIVTVNDVQVTSGTASQGIDLEIGDNTIEVLVIAEKGITKKYTVYVKRDVANDNVNLANLTVSAGTLTPAFSQSIPSYIINVENSIGRIRITPTVAGINATVKVNGISVESGTTSSDIVLNVGDNIISIIVISEKGTTKSYSITVKRPLNNNPNLANLMLSEGIMTPLFVSSLTSYIAYVKNTTESITMTPIVAGLNAIVKVNDNIVTSGTQSNAITLNVGDNPIFVVVTAEDGSSKTYTIIVKRVETYILDIVCGRYNTFIIRSDASLIGIGRNDFGQLGDGTRLNRFTPVEIMTDVLMASAGVYHTMILKKDGTLWAVGRNNYGQLGDGTQVDKLTPVQIMSEVAFVSAGEYHTMILKKDGTLWTVGENNYGQLGDGTQVNRFTPVHIMSDVSFISAGYAYSMIIKKDSTLWAAGCNGMGQLCMPYEDVWPKLTPLQVMTDVIKVASASSYTMFIKKDGTLWGSGWNVRGALGDGTGISTFVPVQVMTGVLDVSVGGEHTIILKQDGSFWATGNNKNGQFGNGETYISLSFLQIAPDALAIMACIQHTIIQKDDGTFWATGKNEYGQFGNDSTTGSTTFIQLPW